MHSYSYAFIAMPGGFGTLDEIFETVTLIQTGKIMEFPVVLVGVEYWEPLVAFMRDRLLAAETIAPRDLNLLLLTDSVEECLGFVCARAMQQFGLTHGPRVSPRPWMAEGSGPR